MSNLFPFFPLIYVKLIRAFLTLIAQSNYPRKFPLFPFQVRPPPGSFHSRSVEPVQSSFLLSVLFSLLTFFLPLLSTEPWLNHLLPG